MIDARPARGDEVAAVAGTLARAFHDDPVTVWLSKPENLPYYEGFGFGVSGRIDLPDGPALWPMWRDPR